jgi:hypothetical protein
MADSMLDITEIIELDSTRIDAVSQPASGASFILMKSAAPTPSGSRGPVDAGLQALQKMLDAEPDDAKRADLAMRFSVARMQNLFARGYRLPGAGG